MSDKQGSLPGFAIPPRGGAEDEEGEGAKQARLKEVDRAQMLLRTVDVEGLIPGDHPARAIWEFVGHLDLSRYTEQIRSVAGAAGRPAYDPHLLVGSSRRVGL